MDALLLKDRSSAVEFYPPERPASATLVVRTDGGTSKEAPTVTVDSLSRTVTAVDATTPEQVFTAGSGSGTPVVGRPYWWVSADSGAHEALVTLAELASNVWKLAAPVPGSSKAQVGDLLKGARLSATVSSSSLSAVGRFWSLEWTVTGADGVVRVYQQTAHVCRTLLVPAMSAGDAAAFVAAAFPGHYTGRTWGYFAELARRASARVWKRVRKDGRFVELVGDSRAFVDAGVIALRLELAKEQLVPPSILDVVSYMDALDRQLSAEVEEALSGQRYDANDDGVVDPEEVEVLNFVRAVRR